MRCAARVSEQALQWRASEDESRRCQRRGTRRFGKEFFCYQHVPELLKVHDAIVERIRAIPIRDILAP